MAVTECRGGFWHPAAVQGILGTLPGVVAMLASRLLAGNPPGWPSGDAAPLELENNCSVGFSTKMSPLTGLGAEFQSYFHSEAQI